MKFLIIAHDGDNMLDNRMKIRNEHIENIKKVKEYGSVICAGALTDGSDKPIGSYLVMDFDNKNLLDKYLESEPYIKNGVWKDVKVEQCKVVIKDDKLQK